MKVWASKDIKISAVVVAENRQRAYSLLRARMMKKIDQLFFEDDVRHVVSEMDLPHKQWTFEDNPDNGDKPISDYISSADVMKESMGES